MPPRLALFAAIFLMGANAMVEGQSVRTETFDAGVGFFSTSRNNHSSGNNFDFSATNFTLNTAAGELGGTFARTAGFSYVADASLGGAFTLADDFSASGELIMKANDGFDGDLRLGYFNTEHPGFEFVGISIAEPSGSANFRAFLVVQGASGPRSSSALVALPVNTPLSFSFAYNGNPDGSGTVSGVIGEAAVSATVPANSGASFSAFGIGTGYVTGGNATQRATMYADNLSYGIATRPPIVLGRVLLSEFMASNEDTLEDGDGNASDWIEIWNSTVAPVDLTGWALTDDAQWPFPARTLQPNEYLVVFASGRTEANYVDAGGNLHTNFKLDQAAGGYLALTSPDGVGGRQNVTVFSNLPKQTEDASYGFSGEADPVREGFFTLPTPGGPNRATVVAGFVDDTHFSHQRGFYDAPFAVTITNITPGATIRYTTNGAAPTESTGAVFDGTPISITTTTTLRAAAFKPGFAPSDVDTQTYLFLSRVPDQPAAPAGFPLTWTGADYEMDQDGPSLQAITNMPGASIAEAKAKIAAALGALPTLSLVMNTDDLFGATSGIYANPQALGRGWERPVSAELLMPGAAPGGAFQIDCGVRIKGFTSRDPNANPKHSLRLAFRSEYGAGKLKYPLFGADAAQSFDTLALRANAQDAWVYSNPLLRKGQFARDEYNRYTHLAMGGLAPHSTSVHLYLNGLYWGVYSITERPDAVFASDYLGGEEEDYEVVRNHEEVSEGTGDFYRTLLAAIQNDPSNFDAGYRNFAGIAPYHAIQGRDPEGVRNPALPILINVRSLVDWMIVNIHSATYDWPGNYYMAADRSPAGTGFHFFSWDAERAMEKFVTEDRTLPHPDDRDTPTKFHHALRANPEYRLFFADRAHAALFHGGPLYVDPAAPTWNPAQPERNRPAARFMALTSALELPLIGESARWGDYRRANPYTVEGDFKSVRADLLSNWFPQRSANVLAHFRSAGLYPATAAPVFSQHGGKVSSGFQLGMTAPAGAIYYTLDGADPRRPATASTPAGLSPNAVAYTGPVALPGSCVVKARTLNGSEWSALNEATFLIGVPASATTLALTEIMYAPTGGSAHEYLEFANTGPLPIELDGVSISGAVNFVFPVKTTLGAGARILVVSDTAAFAAHYGNALPVAGQFEGKLDNAGETIVVTAADGTLIVRVVYDNAPPWPGGADGYSLVLVRPGVVFAPDDPLAWRSSVAPGGSPGGTDSVSFGGGNPFADADGDGFVALLEYALGTSESDPGNRPGLAFSWEFPPGQPPVVTATYPQRLGGDDVDIKIQHSADLALWEPLPAPVILSRDTNPNGTATVIARTALPATFPQAFIRLKIELR